MIFKEIILSLLLTCFIGKEGTPFDLKWEQEIEEAEIEALTLSSFLESYRQSHAFDNLNDKEIKEHLFNYCKSKNFQTTSDIITARHKQKLAGIAIFEKRDAETAYLAEVMVAPEFWSQGLGKELIFSIFTHEPSIKKIVLIAEKANTKTLKFYQSLGFVASEHLPSSSYITFTGLQLR